MKTINTKARIMSLFVALMLVFGIMPLSAGTVFAADGTLSYVALGDSISTGYGLSSKTEEGFTYLLANELGYDLTNLAVDGNTSAGILAQMQEDEVKAAVEDADLITITAGGNDLMALLYQAVGAKLGITDVTEVMAKLEAGDLTALQTAISLLDSKNEDYIVETQAFDAAVASIITSLNGVVAEIRKLNSDAQVIVATQYNPYVDFAGASFQFIFINIDLNPVYAGFEEGIAVLNDAIKDNAQDGGYYVADVKAAFDAYSGTEDLYNAQPPAGTTGANLDFHPTADGHEQIADAMADAIVESQSVTVEATCDLYWGTVTGGGVYKIGETVVLEAQSAEDTKFMFWIDDSVDMADDPTEAELREAIVSYDAKFEFIAQENAYFEAVFAVFESVSIVPMLIAGTDEQSLLDAVPLDEDGEYDFIILGEEQIQLPGEYVEEILTIGDQQYRFEGFILYSYDEATDTEVTMLQESLTIDAMPLYGSSEWWDWFTPISDGIYVAYMPYTPSEQEPDESEPPTVSEGPVESEEPNESEEPTESEEPSEVEQSSEQPAVSQESAPPQTGDDSSVMLWFALLFLCGGVFAGVVVRKRKSVAE